MKAIVVLSVKAWRRPTINEHRVAACDEWLNANWELLRNTFVRRAERSALARPGKSLALIPFVSLGSSGQAL